MTEPVLWIEAEDPAMVTAIRAAQNSFLEFARLADLEHYRIVPAYESVSIKAFFPDPEYPGRGEHVFLTDVSTDGKSVTATLNTCPNFESNLEEGDVVTFSVNQISDWFIAMDDGGIGGFTIDVMWGQFSEEQRQMYIDYPPISWFRERLVAGRTAQMELDAIPVCDQCGLRELHTGSYKGSTCGLCVNGAKRVSCTECQAPLIRFEDQSPVCHQCHAAVHGE